jgi:hypothetical protein
MRLCYLRKRWSLTWAGCVSACGGCSQPLWPAAIAGKLRHAQSVCTTSDYSTVGIQLCRCRPRCVSLKAALLPSSNAASGCLLCPQQFQGLPCGLRGTLTGANLATRYAAAELMCDVPLPNRSPQQQQQSAACRQKVRRYASIANAPRPYSSQRCALQVDLRQRLVVLAAAETKQASAAAQAEEYITVSLKDCPRPSQQSPPAAWWGVQPGAWFAHSSCCAAACCPRWTSPSPWASNSPAAMMVVLTW